MVQRHRHECLTASGKRKRKKKTLLHRNNRVIIPSCSARKTVCLPFAQYKFFNNIRKYTVFYFFFLHSKPFNPRFPSRPTTTIVRARYPTPACPHIRGVRSLNCHRGLISSSSTTDTRETRGIYNNTLYYCAIYIHVIRDRRTILQTAIMRIRRWLKYYPGRIRKPIHNRWFPNGYRILAF